MKTLQNAPWLRQTARADCNYYFFFASSSPLLWKKPICLIKALSHHLNVLFHFIHSLSTIIFSFYRSGLFSLISLYFQTSAPVCSAYSGFSWMSSFSRMSSSYFPLFSLSWHTCSTVVLVKWGSFTRYHSHIFVFVERKVASRSKGCVQTLGWPFLPLLSLWTVKCGLVNLAERNNRHQENHHGTIQQCLP